MSRRFVPLALIAFGVIFLLGSFIPERNRDELILLGIGVAFLIGRVTTGRYGYAVPAGLLIGISSYDALQNAAASNQIAVARGPALFFVSMGLGFVLVYLIGSRPWVMWPLFPAAVLLGLGLVVFGVSVAAPLAGLAWIIAYWPAALVIVGVWFLVRDWLPPAPRRVLAAAGGLALLAYGVLAAAASVASGGLANPALS